MTGELVVGVDGCRAGWLALRLEAGAFAGAAVHGAFEEVLRAYPAAGVVAVDIPIGLPRGRAPRRADVEARRLLGRRASTLFLVPPRPVLEESTYRAARRAAERLGLAGVTAQAYNLREKIFDVEGAARRDRRVHEVHPEVSFRALAGGRALEARKKTWNGLFERIALLRRAGIRLPATLADAGRAGADDVVDAAAAAWTALRIHRGEAQRLPPSGPRFPTIWY